jgi:hypothetical protein
VRFLSGSGDGSHQESGTPEEQDSNIPF